MPETGSPWPRSDSIGIEVTADCNSTCSHCFVRARAPRGISLAPDLVRTIVLEAYQAGYRHLHITGGEPLLWDGLLQAFDYAFTLGYESAFLNTNGTLLTAEVSRKLATYDGLSLSVSLQGPKRLHDRIRGKGSYDRSRTGIENALSAGLSVYIFTTAGRSLIPALPRFAHGLFRGFPDIKQLTLIQLIRVPGDVFDLSQEVLRPEDFVRLVRMVSLLNLCGLRLHILNNPLATVVAKALKVSLVPLSAPLYRQGSVLITAERRITLAHSTDDDFGTYEPGALLKILDSAGYSRAVSQDRSVCENCDFYATCSIEEMERPSEWYRDMHPDVPYCRRVLTKASSYG